MVYVALQVLLCQLYGVGFRYTFHSEEPGSLYREQEKVHYVLIDNKLYSIDEYVSENGQIESFTTSFTRCWFNDLT